MLGRQGHPAWIFTCREGGRRRRLYVRKRVVGTVRVVRGLGRLVEALLIEEGVMADRGTEGGGCGLIHPQAPLRRRNPR